MVSLKDRLIHGWNAFANPKENDAGWLFREIGSASYGSRPDLLRLGSSPERSITASVLTRVGIDASTVPLRHARVDQNGSYLETIPSGLNRCLSISANIDQTARAFIQDAVMTLCDEGAIAIVPVVTSTDPRVSGSYDIWSLRVGTIKTWFPQHVSVDVYNEITGLREERMFPKTLVAIVENPLYSVMNESNSTLNRLKYKLGLLDAIDQQSGSGKLDLLIQVPFAIRSQQKRDLAEQRLNEIESQLVDSRHGIAYIDSTEHITQLNRPVENNLMAQIEYLTRMLFGQLGITEEVLLGSADEQTMLNYFARTVEPILDAILDSMTRTFLTRTAMSQGQTLKRFKDPFKWVPFSEFSKSVDSLTRNAVMSSNEVRAVVGLQKSDDPDADKLRNKNLNEAANPTDATGIDPGSLVDQNGSKKEKKNDKTPF